MLLSFSSARAELARRIGGDLRRAGIGVRHDPWDGGGGVPATRPFAVALAEVRCILPILTPSDAAPTWIGDEWKDAVHDPARAAGIPILPIRGEGELDAVPAFLRDRSFADLRGGDYSHELRRLIETVRDLSDDPTIALPETSNEQEAARRGSETPAAPLVLEFGTVLARELGADDGATFAGLIPMMLDGLYYEVGVAFPVPHTRPNSELPPWSFRVVINGVPAFGTDIMPGCVLVNETVAALQGRSFNASPAINPVTGATCAWLPGAQAAAARDAGLTTWDGGEFVILALSDVLRRRAADFLSIDETTAMLSSIEPVFPLLVAETVPKTVSLFVFTDVLRRLVAELVCIRDLRRILLSLAEWGRVERDPLILTEFVRAALRRQISHRLARGTNELPVLLLHPDIETAIRDAMKHTPTGSYVDLEPAHLRRIVDAIRGSLASLPDGAAIPAILTNVEIRSSVARMVTPSMPGLQVTSYHELRPDMRVQPIGRIAIDGFAMRPGVTSTGLGASS